MKKISLKILTLLLFSVSFVACDNPRNRVGADCSERPHEILPLCNEEEPAQEIVNRCVVRRSYKSTLENFDPNFAISTCELSNPHRSSIQLHGDEGTQTVLLPHPETIARQLWQRGDSYREVFPDLDPGSLTLKATDAVSAVNSFGRPVNLVYFVFSLENNISGEKRLFWAYFSVDRNREVIQQGIPVDLAQLTHINTSLVGVEFGQEPLSSGYINLVKIDNSKTNLIFNFIADGRPWIYSTDLEFNGSKAVSTTTIDDTSIEDRDHQAVAAGKIIVINDHSIDGQALAMVTFAYESALCPNPAFYSIDVAYRDWATTNYRFGYSQIMNVAKTYQGQHSDDFTPSFAKLGMSRFTEEGNVACAFKRAEIDTGTMLELDLEAEFPGDAAYQDAFVRQGLNVAELSVLPVVLTGEEYALRQWTAHTRNSMDGTIYIDLANQANFDSASAYLTDIEYPSSSIMHIEFDPSTLSGYYVMNTQFDDGSWKIPFSAEEVQNENRFVDE